MLQIWAYFFCRHCILSATFHDCLLGGNDSGVLALSVRLLEARGFKVTVIKHTDLERIKTKLDQVKKIEQKLRNA